MSRRGLTPADLSVREDIMFKFRARSLATKLIAVTGGTIALVLLSSNFVLISQTQDRVETLVFDGAKTEARAIASDIAGSVGELAAAARTMSGVLGRGHGGQSTDRAGAINLLKAWSSMPLPSAAGSPKSPRPTMERTSSAIGSSAAMTRARSRPIGRRTATAIYSFQPSRQTIRPNGTALRRRAAKDPSPSHISPRAPMSQPR